VDHLVENLGAIDVELTPDDLRQMSTELARFTVHGLRMDEDNMNVVED
jgi:diketogulonate reductase-like aldo/keto reductase